MLVVVCVSAAGRLPARWTMVGHRLQYADRQKPLYLYINSTGTTRADGETVGFETEGTAIFDTMRYLKNEARRCRCRAGRPCGT